MDPRSDKILARFIARGRLLWVPAEDMAWNHIITGESVCIRNWLGEQHCRDIHNKPVPPHEKMVLDIDALYRAWEGLRPESRWNKTKGRRPAAEAMASRLIEVVRSLPVVPLAYNQWFDKTDIRETARLLYVRHMDGVRRKPNRPVMLLGPSFCPMEIE